MTALLLVVPAQEHAGSLNTGGRVRSLRAKVSGKRSRGLGRFPNVRFINSSQGSSAVLCVYSVRRLWLAAPRRQTAGLRSSETPRQSFFFTS